MSPHRTILCTVYQIPLHSVESQVHLINLGSTVAKAAVPASHEDAPYVFNCSLRSLISCRSASAAIALPSFRKACMAVP